MTKVANIGLKEVQFTPAADLPKLAPQTVLQKDTLAGKNTSDNCLVGFFKSIFSAVKNFFSWILFGSEEKKVEGKKVLTWNEVGSRIKSELNHVKRLADEENAQGVISFLIHDGKVLDSAVSKSEFLDQVGEQFSKKRKDPPSGIKVFEMVSYVISQPDPQTGKRTVVTSSHSWELNSSKGHWGSGVPMDLPYDDHQALVAALEKKALKK